MTYLLVACVTAVWGIIFYRVFLAASTDETTIVQQTAIKPVEASLDDYSVKDTFTLALNYRDPFSGKAEEERSMPVQAANTLVAPKPVMPVALAINWSMIRYSGFIINPGSKKIVAIMAVNNKERMMAEGETLDGLKLLKNFKDSVKVEYQGKAKFIVLK